jgi:hypothetical protein
MTYDVEFDDGLVREYTANIIADGLYSQTDDDGFTTNHLDGLVDFRKLSNAVSWPDAYIQAKRGAKRPCGWQFLAKRVGKIQLGVAQRTSLAKFSQKRQNL